MKQELIRLGAMLASEDDAAFSLWTWLPSHKIAKEHHGDYSDEFRPPNADVMKEASMYLAHLKRPDDLLSVGERAWFTTCPCGEGHGEDSGKAKPSKRTVKPPRAKQR